MSELTTPAFHGYAPPSEEDPNRLRVPLSIAVSRETGCRGESIAKRTAELLGWQLIDQEALEYITQNTSYQTGMERPLSEPALNWIESRLGELAARGPLGTHPEMVPLVRVILEVAVNGHCVILGRGAGCVLPQSARLYVRLIAPEKNRIAYLAQVERLSLPEAAKYVYQRDEARRHFITEKFGRPPSDVDQFDLVLNTAQFGIEGCAQLIVAAAQQRSSFLVMSPTG